MAKSSRIDRCFAKPVIPVISELPARRDLLATASCVILQGTTLVDLPRLVDAFGKPPLDDVLLLVHIDLIAGLENNEVALEFLAQLPRIQGVVTIHHHLIAPAKRLGFVSVLRIFLSDSRALERGLKIIAKWRPDIVDILPHAAAIMVADEFRSSGIPCIAGGLCRREEEVRRVLASGCRAATSTRPGLWELNCS
jgi:glycerol uptake operon antiterminator